MRGIYATPTHPKTYTPEFFFPAKAPENGGNGRRSRFLMGGLQAYLEGRHVKLTTQKSSAGRGNMLVPRAFWPQKGRPYFRDEGHEAP